MANTFGAEVIPAENVGRIVSASRVRQDLTRIMNKYANAGYLKATTYPAPRPKQQYKRTYDLQRGWVREGAHEVAGELQSSLKNSMPYAKYVYGSLAQGQRQLAAFRNRWPTERQLIDEAAYVRECQAAIARGH